MAHLLSGGGSAAEAFTEPGWMKMKLRKEGTMRKVFILGGRTKTKLRRMGRERKVVVEIVIFQRRRPDLEKCDEEKRTTKEKLREMVTKLLETLKKFLAALPLILSSLVFNTGTLVLTIIVTEWVSAVYIVLVLLLNMIVSFLYPNSVVRTTKEKLELTYKFSKLDEEREIQKIRENRMTRGLFNSWANLFVFLRPVEKMSYNKITHVLLLQPLRFVVNIITLFILY